MRNLFLYLAFTLLLTACKKDAVQQAQAHPPSITSISPSTGQPATQITISGSDFSPTASADIVMFNGIAAIVTSASSSSIVATVPAGAGIGPITVTTAQGTAISTAFTYIPDIYIGGGEFNSAGFIVGKFWKNGIPTAVSDGTKNVFISSMVVSGSDVYMSGYEAGSNGSNNIAKYWKNGTAVALSDGSHSATAGSMVVVGNDVYVAGTESNGTKDVAKYWKNGVATALTDGTNNAAGSAIVVSGNDIYVSGEENAPYGSNAIAKYWKNGIPTIVTNSTNTLTTAVQMAVSGNDVYVIINEVDSNNSIYQYWKNGVTTQLTGASQIDQIIIAGSDVYMAGRELNTAVYWKNGIATPLTDGTNIAFAHAITVYNNDVYVAGDEFNGTIKVGKYWKNGVAAVITNDAFDVAAWGIAVR